MPSKVKVIGVFTVEVEIPHGLKQKDWEKKIHDNLKYPVSTGSTDFDAHVKVKLVGKKVRYE